MLGIIGAVANVGISFITAKATGQDYGWYDLFKDSLLGALCAIPYTSTMGLVSSIMTKVLEDSTSEEGITNGTLISREMIRIKGKWYRKEVYGYRNKTYFKYIKQ